MRYKVTQIEFDFTDDFGDEALDVETQDEIYDEVIGTIWEADDGDDLVEQITSTIGWCINQIDYKHQTI